MKGAKVIVSASIFAVLATSFAEASPESALDKFQFDGVISDAVLNDAHQTRRQWLDQNPAPAKEYWEAWDCKDRACDSKWEANIRARAALVERTNKDPAPVVASKPLH